MHKKYPIIKIFMLKSWWNKTCTQAENKLMVSLIEGGSGSHRLDGFTVRLRLSQGNVTWGLMQESRDLNTADTNQPGIRQNRWDQITLLRNWPRDNSWSRASATCSVCLQPAWSCTTTSGMWCFLMLLGYNDSDFSLTVITALLQLQTSSVSDRRSSLEARLSVRDLALALWSTMSSPDVSSWTSQLLNASVSLPVCLSCPRTIQDEYNSDLFFPLQSRIIFPLLYWYFQHLLSLINCILNAAVEHFSQHLFLNVLSE